MTRSWNWDNPIEKIKKNYKVEIKKNKKKFIKPVYNPKTLKENYEV
jgi:hypothetical protein